MIVVNIIKIADAIVDALNGGGFPPPYTPGSATRSWDRKFTIAEFATLRISVVPSAVSTEWESRDSRVDTYQIIIGVQKKLDTVSDETRQVDELCALTATIADYLRNWDMGEAPYPTLMTANINPLVAQEHISELRIFTSVIELSFSSRVRM